MVSGFPEVSVGVVEMAGRFEFEFGLEQRFARDSERVCGRVCGKLESLAVVEVVAVGVVAAWAPQVTSGDTTWSIL